MAVSAEIQTEFIILEEGVPKRYSATLNIDDSGRMTLQTDVVLFRNQSIIIVARDTNPELFGLAVKHENARENRMSIRSRAEVISVVSPEMGVNGCEARIKLAGNIKLARDYSDLG